MAVVDSMEEGCANMATFVPPPAGGDDFLPPGFGPSSTTEPQFEVLGTADSADVLSSTTGSRMNGTWTVVHLIISHVSGNSSLILFLIRLKCTLGL